MVGIVNNAVQGAPQAPAEEETLPPIGPDSPASRAAQDPQAATGQGTKTGDEVGEEILADEEPATEEEQDAFDRVVYAAMDVLHSEETKPDILQMLEAGKDAPGETVAQLAVMVFMQLDQQSGGNVPEEVIVQGIEQIMSLAIEMGEDAGFFTFDESQQQAASKQMWTLLAEAGYIDEEDIQTVGAELSPEEVQRLSQL